MDLKWAGFVLGAGALACGAIGAALASPAAAQGVNAGALSAHDSRPAAAHEALLRPGTAVSIAAVAAAGPAGRPASPDLTSIAAAIDTAR